MAERERWFKEEDESALRDFWQVYEADFNAITESMSTDFSRLIVTGLSQDARKAALARAILHDGWATHETAVRGVAAHAHGNGVSFSRWHSLYDDFSHAIVPRLVEAYQNEPLRLAAVIIVAQRYIQWVLQVIAEEYLAIQTRALAENERRYDLLFDRSPLPMWVYDVPTLRFVAVNDAAVKHYGYSREEFSRMTLADIRPEDDVAEMRLSVEQGGRGVVTRSWRHRRKDGSLLQVEIWSNDFALDDSDMRLIVVLDITERKQLEEQFRQTQKMEAIGKLAGGIAHDFNNLLSVILSYSTLALHGLPEGDPLRADLEEIERAGERAATLTRQLLAFNRQQMLRPILLDLNVTVIELQKMLQRLIGEDVELTTQLATDLELIRADPSQLDQVLMNLVVNARDAMHKGGTIIIETSNVELDADYVRSHIGAEAGPHVMLAVSDTGTGMSKEVQARAFEPFFTTKETGRGRASVWQRCSASSSRAAAASIYIASSVGARPSRSIFRASKVPLAHAKLRRAFHLAAARSRFCSWKTKSRCASSPAMCSVARAIRSSKR